MSMRDTHFIIEWEEHDSRQHLFNIYALAIDMDISKSSGYKGTKSVSYNFFLMYDTFLICYKVSDLYIASFSEKKNYDLSKIIAQVS